MTRSKQIKCHHCGELGTENVMQIICRGCKRGYVHLRCADEYIDSAAAIEDSTPGCARCGRFCEFKKGAPA